MVNEKTSVADSFLPSTSFLVPFEDSEHERNDFTPTCNNSIRKLRVKRDENFDYTLKKF